VSHPADCTILDDFEWLVVRLDTDERVAEVKIVRD
jgi:hypothetical protein